MCVLLLGATGSLGSAVLDELLSHGHSVLALARSDAAEAHLRGKTAKVLRGDLRAPDAWAGAARDVDAIIHLAATFSDDEGEVDRGVVDALIAACAQCKAPKRFIYTGGCWMYGATGDTVATEASPFNPINAFAWVIGHAAALSCSPAFDVNILHPAMVYDGDGGVFSMFSDDAKRGEPVEVWGSLDARWPLVHRLDVASAYRLVLESAEPGENYNIAAEPGVRVSAIVRVINARYGISHEPRVRDVASVIAEHGDWALGPSLDQQMSGVKIMNELGWQPKVPSFEINVSAR